MDDGSRDRTAAIAARDPVTLLRTRHAGKARVMYFMSPYWLFVMPLCVVNVPAALVVRQANLEDTPVSTSR